MKLCIVDDHEVVRAGLRMALWNDSTLEIVGEAGSGEETMQVVRRTLPDVVLTDFRLPDTTGDELCRRIRAGYRATAVVILTTYLSEDVVQRSIDAGAAAFVTKAAGLGELRRALADLADGRHHDFEGGAAAVVRRQFAQPDPSSGRPLLTPQQERVLELMAKGMTYREIATQVHISESTVRFHVQRLKERVGVRTKSELIAVAVRSALIAPGADARP